MSWLLVVGIVVFFLGLMVSIALHELGHLSFAKLFGVRTTQYMVGFGPTLWSRHRGETEYGIKWIPFGGYIRMIGMLPPRKEDAPGKVRRASTGPFQGLIETARGQSLEEVRPSDENRVFYRKLWWQKAIIMVAGPAMNILLAVFILGIVAMGIGLYTPQPVVRSVSECVIPAAENRKCQPGDPATPAASAGLKPGDRFVSFAGQRIESGEQVRNLVRSSPNREVAAVVRRGGRDINVSVRLVTNEMPIGDASKRTKKVGFIGVLFLEERTHQGPGVVLDQVGLLATNSAMALARMPEKMVGVWHAAFGGEKRDPNGPIGVVGASRIGGEIAAAKDYSGIDKLAFFLQTLAMVNFALGVFNLLPLLPLDGGHIAGALWEGLKRLGARIARRPDPGYVDVAKALPLAYAMAAVILAMGVLLLYADLVNPVRMTG